MADGYISEIKLPDNKMYLLKDKESIHKNNELLTTNPFAPISLTGAYISKIDNAFYAADQRWNVTGTNINNISGLFNGDYESQSTITAGNTAIINIDFDPNHNNSTYFPGYPYGYILVSFYYTFGPANISGRVYCNYDAHGIGWHNISFSPMNDNTDKAIVYRSQHQGYYNISQLEITITANSSDKTSVTQIEMHLDRPNSARTPFLSKYNAETLYYDLTAPKFIGALQGNADTATKFNSTRKIELTGAVTGSATTDGSNGWTINTSVTVPVTLSRAQLISTEQMAFTNWLPKYGSGTAIPAKTMALFADGLAIKSPATNADAGWIRVTGTDETDTVLEIATSDDANKANSEKIVVRQYNSSSAQHEAILLGKIGDVYGATSFPVQVEAPKFLKGTSIVPDTGNTTGNVGGTTTPVYVEAGVIKAGTALGGAAYKAENYYALSGHNHDSTYSYIHLTDYDFTDTQPLSKYVTFDKSRPIGAPKEEWYNGFISSHSNYHASYIINGHTNQSEWYVGHGIWREANTPHAPAPTWYLLAHSGNVGTGDNDGQVKIAGQNISVKGLKALAYKDSLDTSDIPNLSWNKITSDKPTTISGYGITDAATNNHSHTLKIGNKSLSVSTSEQEWNVHDILYNTNIIYQSTSWDIITPGIYAVTNSSHDGSGHPGSTDGQTAPYSYGHLIVTRADGYGAAQFYISHVASGAKAANKGIRYRSGWNVNNTDKTEAERWQAWATILDDKNFNLYAPTLTGTGASGSWDISITGAAAKATADASGNTITTTYATKTEVNGLLAAADAMIFKGTLGTGGTITAVPDGTSGKTYQAGYTYKVITAGKYANIQCEVGDLLIAIADSTNGQTAVNNAHWTVAQTNIDGAVTGPTSSTDGNIALFDGETGKIIKNSSYSPSSFATAAQGTKADNALPTSGGTMTGNIHRYYSDHSTEPLITALSTDKNILLWLVGHGASAAATTTSNHYKLQYYGQGNSPNNYLKLIGHASSDNTDTTIVQFNRRFSNWKSIVFNRLCTYNWSRSR